MLIRIYDLQFLRNCVKESVVFCSMMLVDVLLVIARFFIFALDIITLPLYLFVQKPWAKRAEIKKAANWHEIASNENHVGVIQETSTENEQYRELILKNNVDTVDKVWNNAVDLYDQKLCLGTRTVIGEEEEKQRNGKVFKKLNLGEYKWMNYQQAHQISTQFGCGLRRLGQEPKMPIAIYAETKAEWMMSALGAFSQSIIVSTLYTNLGDEAVCHGINETQVSVIITSHALLPKFKTMLKSCPHIKHIIVIEDQILTTSLEGFKDGVEIVTFYDVVKMGREDPCEPNPPDTEDLAIIMYTSGSTGVPKGVMISHKNLVATSTTILFLRKFDNKKDMYIAYLPLAHVLELLSECTMLLLGIPIGYSSPNTMTNLSTAVKRGQKGDAVLLSPTIMCTVPLILDRIYKNISEGVNKKGNVFKKVFDFCYFYKLWWNSWGVQTPVFDRLVFNKLKLILGGRMDLMIVGGAPLASKTQEYVRTCLGARLVQGYTMTETTCSGTCQIPGDLTVGNVGGPMAGMEVRLIDWEEGKYKISDKPYPRGELVLGGDPITRGYYNNPEKTAEDFFVENGKQFFKSGDIGELRDDGSFRLIDRKKDLVKLQLGEYVSLGKVEAQMKTNPLVDNICVYADSFRSNTIALIVPIKEALESLAKNYINDEVSYEDICNDPGVVQEVLKKLSAHGKSNGLEKFEIPTEIQLCPVIWLPDSGLVTAAFKLKRKAIQDAFQSSIDQMYGKRCEL
eukprot:GFUD01026282.1.p1 GENE.GFUD01026282.1~~GFUD01026282.1.p1  ORF type:complete len:737 (-),score=160.12 GFUD01026282.1:30-2240(-)